MKFEDYKKTNDLVEICKTEQSEILLTGKGILCKHYFNNKDKGNESFFYNFFRERDLIKIPEIYLRGEDFIEIEFLKREDNFNLIKTINEISNLYKKTLKIHLPIQKLDLSREKLLYRLNYLKDEIKKREVNPEILKELKKFVDKKYSYPEETCIVHGDLKSPHVFQTEEGIKFIDFALSGIANPWYDLSFLYMEEQENKKKVFSEVTNFLHDNLRKEFNFNKKEISDYFQSAIFYRTLYLFGFALRHRQQNSLDRIINELNEIINLER